MAVAEELRRWYDYMNKCDWSDPAPDVFAPDVQFHVPGLGIELTGLEAVMTALRAHWEADDVHVDANDIVENGALVVAFLTDTQNRGGRRISGSICTVGRIENGQVAETWTVRGSGFVPVDEG